MQKASVDHISKTREDCMPALEIKSASNTRITFKDGRDNFWCLDRNSNCGTYINPLWIVHIKSCKINFLIPLECRKMGSSCQYGRDRDGRRPSLFSAAISLKCFLQRRFGESNLAISNGIWHRTGSMGWNHRR
jgi:hypothetical protein